MFEFIYNWLLQQDFGMDAAVTYARWLVVALTVLFAGLAYLLVRYVITPAVIFSLDHTESRIGSPFLNRKIAQRTALVAALLVVYLMTPVFLASFAPIIVLVQNVVLLLMIVLGVMIANAVLDGVQEMYLTRDDTRDVPIKGFIQVIRIVVYAMAALFILAILVGQTPLYLLSGLGAVMAILTIVFRDPLLGLVAGVQLTADDLVARGDWIEMPKYDAAGEVIDVALTTVKIRNADQSITTVPTYSLISESFKNWRGIDETNARRIKRALYIDLMSVRFCTADSLTALAKDEHVAAVLEETAETAVSPPPPAGNGVIGNGRNATNLRLFRSYISAYLRQHPQIYADRTLVVRELAPTENGLPIEVYAYAALTDFVAFEELQADIFDHLVAMAPRFNLRLYQRPSGADLRLLARADLPER